MVFSGISRYKSVPDAGQWREQMVTHRLSESNAHSILGNSIRWSHDTSGSNRGTRWPRRIDRSAGHGDSVTPLATAGLEPPAFHSTQCRIVDETGHRGGWLPTPALGNEAVCCINHGSRFLSPSQHWRQRHLRKGSLMAI